MKKIVLLLLLLCGSILCIANPVSEKTAHQVAYNFLSKRTNVSFDAIKLVYGQRFPKSKDTAYYVYSVENSSFVIVAGDDIAKPIWAYSFDNGFGNDLPENVKGFLDDLVNELQAAREQGIKCDYTTQQQWLQMTEGCSSASIASSRMAPSLWESVLGDNTTNPPLTTSGAVAPLITTHWQQDAPYNSLCPLLSNGSSHSAVGCGAVAVAQILRYWQYPQNPRGMHVNPTNTTPLSVDFDTVTFDYTLMPNTITSSSATTEILEVAKMMYYCGVALDIIYSTTNSISGSAAKYFAPLTALVSFFRYDDSIGLARKTNYADTTWDKMLQAELALGRPFIYRGGGSNNHIFVCDGCAESNMYHFNMGHGGWDDGYYLLSSISMSGQTFNYSSNQLAVLRIVPDSACHTVTAQKHGISKFIVDDTLDVYRQRTLITRNGYQFSNMESDRNNHTMIFVSGDTTKRLKIEALNVSVYGDVRLYDGENMDTLIDGSSGYLHSNQYPKYSTRNAIVIRDSAGLSSNDYAFRLTLECRKVSNIGYNINDDTIHLFWNENGGASNWQVKYGLTGFQHGEGTLINTDTTACNIVGLLDNRQYDFYVRAVCGGSSYSEWEMIRFIVPPSGGAANWSEVVTSQPEGYQVGADGNIYIYSNEGLAWLISTCNGLNGQSSYGVYNKSVYLMADVDMSDYQWTPLNHMKKFDGRNHSINGLVISDTLSNYHMDIGFVEGVYNGDSVMNTLFKNCLFQCGNAHYIGCVAGTCSGTIMNCGATGSISSSGSYIGGLTGSLYTGNIVNSYAIADVSGYNYLGGAVGSSGSISYYQNQLANCYSSGQVYSRCPYSNPASGVFIGQANPNNNTNYLAYWHQQDTTLSGCGNNVSGFLPFEMMLVETDSVVTIIDELGNISEYFMFDTVWTLVSPTTIGGQSVTTLVDALNAWVDSNNTNGEYRRWTNDTGNINQGFPVFDVTRYDVSLQCDTDNGTVVGDGRYVEETEVTISAIANNCYHFTQWSDGNTSSSRIITISQDTALTAIFAPNAPSDSTIYVTECDQYVWKDSTYSTSGVYTFDTFTSAGCDSIVFLNLTINYSAIIDTTVYIENNYSWRGSVYTSSGYYADTIASVNGCDSVMILRLIIASSTSTGAFGVDGGTCASFSIAEGSAVRFSKGNLQYNSALGNHATADGSTAQGTWRFAEHQWDVIGEDNSNISSTYNGWVDLFGWGTSGWNSGAIAYQPYSTSINYANYYPGGAVTNDLTDTFAYADWGIYNAISNGGNAPNMWRTLTVDEWLYLLLVRPASTIGNKENARYVTAVVNNVPGIIVFPDTYVHPDNVAVPIFGCDEYHDDELAQWINPVNVYADSDWLEMENVGCVFLPAAGLREDTVSLNSNQGGSLYYWSSAHEGVHGGSQMTAGAISMCDNENFNSTIMWNTDYHRYYGFSVRLVTPNNSTLSSDTVAIECDGFTWHGITHNATPSIAPTYTYTSSLGCDSIVTLNLVVNHSSIGTETVTVCDAFVWHGIEYTASTVEPTFITENASGCDSVTTLHLTVNHTTIGDTMAVACDSFTWRGVEYTSSTNLATDTIVNATGCDSIITLSLTINNSDLSGNESITTCGSYTWNGEIYNNSGTYTYSTTTTMGCDSLATLTLIIDNIIIIRDSATACDSHQWNGITYNSSGTYAYTNTAASGCDSIMTLFLTINYSDTNSSETHSACDNYTWNGNTYEIGGVYIFDTTTKEGCDSVVTLNLTINHPVNSSYIEVGCDSIVWENVTYTSGGTYLYSSVDTNGCTQTDTLYLTLHHSSSPTNLDLVVVDTVLPYVYEDVTITGSGYYTIPLTNVDGCDSIIQLHVIVNHPGVGIADVSKNIVIYPNPTDGIVTITSQDVLGIVVYDILGCEVVREKRTNAIDLSYFPRGVYIMKVALPEGETVHKIVKK